MLKQPSGVPPPYRVCGKQTLKSFDFIILQMLQSDCLSHCELSAINVKMQKAESLSSFKILINTHNF